MWLTFSYVWRAVFPKRSDGPALPFTHEIRFCHCCPPLQFRYMLYKRENSLMRVRTIPDTFDYRKYIPDRPTSQHFWRLYRTMHSHEGVDRPCVETTFTSSLVAIMDNTSIFWLSVIIFWTVPNKTLLSEFKLGTWILDTSPLLFPLCSDMWAWHTIQWVWRLNYLSSELRLPAAPHWIFCSFQTIHLRFLRYRILTICRRLALRRI